MLDLLLPPRCVICGIGGRQLCAGCRDELPRIEPPLCARCGAPTVWPVERCRECAGRRLGFASARAAVGYDPAARRLALELAALWELPCLPLLERTRGGRQRGSSAAERRTVRGAFRATAAAPRRVAVIDDVYTTGATAAAAATALRAAGARRVEAVAFARALRRG